MKSVAARSVIEGYSRHPAVVAHTCNASNAALSDGKHPTMHSVSSPHPLIHASVMRHPKFPVHCDSSEGHAWVMHRSKLTSPQSSAHEAGLSVGSQMPLPHVQSSGQDSNVSSASQILLPHGLGGGPIHPTVSAHCPMVATSSLSLFGAPSTHCVMQF